MRRKVALLICDVQNGIVRQMHGGFKAVDRISLLARFAKKCQLDRLCVPTIVSAQFLPHKLGTTIEQISSEIGQHPDHLLIDKERYSMFDSALHTHLSKRSIGEVAICGFQTEWCVRKTAIDFLKKDYAVTIVSDASASSIQSEHQSAIREMETMSNLRVTTTHSFIVDHLTDASCPISRWYVKQLKNRSNK